MKRLREQMWEAYLDGELLASEAAEFEASLSDMDRRRIAADMSFERALAERLSENAACPDEVWERTRALVKQHQRPAPFSITRRRRWYWGVATLAAAASVAFVLSLFTPGGPVPDSSSVILAASSTAELSARSEIEPGRESAQRYLDSKGVDLELDESRAHEVLNERHHSLEVLGARHEFLNGEPVTEVFFGCCGHPVKLLLAERHSAAAREISLAAAQDSDIQATRNVGDYFTAVVTEHSAHGLLDIFQAPMY